MTRHRTDDSLMINDTLAEIPDFNDSGVLISRAEYLARYPELQLELCEEFACVEEFCPVSPTWGTGQDVMSLTVSQPE